ISVSDFNRDDALGLRGGTLESPCLSNDCGDCNDCGNRYLCHCLRITEEEVVRAVTVLQLRTLDDLRQHTGAADRCTTCHLRLRLLIHRHAQPSSSSPICSVR